jgi:hypothetical protein
MPKWLRRGYPCSVSKTFAGVNIETQDQFFVEVSDGLARQERTIGTIAADRVVRS